VGLNFTPSPNDARVIGGLVRECGDLDTVVSDFGVYKLRKNPDDAETAALHKYVTGIIRDDANIDARELF
jgi:hypothetical protein